jgi:hypothetical protein
VAARAVPVLGPLGHPEKVGGAAQIAGALGRDQDQRSGAVVLHAAVKEPEGLDDPAGALVRLRSERPSVHDRPRVGLGVMIRGKGDGALRRGFDGVVMQEAHDFHGEALGGRDQAIGERERALSGCGRRRRRRSEALELSLRQRAEDDHAVGVAGGDGGRRVAHRRRAAPAATAPLHVGKAQVGQPEGRRQA